MKKLDLGKRILTIVLILTMILQINPVKGAEKEIFYLFEEEITDSNISYTFENGVLTISGSGIIDPSIARDCVQKDIKKVVINPGPTGIGDYAFMECTNLTSITIPNTVKAIGHRALANIAVKEITIPNSVEKIGEEILIESINLKKITMPGNFECVNYNDWEEYLEYPTSRLFDDVDELYLNSTYNPGNKWNFTAKKIYTAENDNKYKSYDGVVYTKDGKTLVQVPYKMKKVEVRKGCQTIKLTALTYNQIVGEKEKIYCADLEKIVIPKSLRKIVDDSEKGKHSPANYKVLRGCKWEIHSKKLEGAAIENLLKISSKKEKEKLLKSPMFKIKKQKGMYITKDQDLLKYDGKDKNITIPSNVKRIGRDVFSQNMNIRQVKLSKKTKEIGDSAFYQCSKLSKIIWNKKIRKIEKKAFFGSRLKSVKMPNSIRYCGEESFAESDVSAITFSKKLKEIPEEMFANCMGTINKLVIPGNIKKIGKMAFFETAIESLKIEQGLQEIGRSAFEHTSEWNKLVLPKSIKKLSELAFSDVTVKQLEIRGNYNAFDGHVFGEIVELVFNKKASKQFTLYEIASYSVDENSTSYEIRYIKVHGASGMEIQTADNEKFDNATSKKIANKSTYVNIDVNNDCKYFRIRPYVKKGNKTTSGAWSTVSKLEKVKDF